MMNECILDRGSDHDNQDGMVTSDWSPVSASAESGACFSKRTSTLERADRAL
jgi:hypothetical protein